MPRGSQGLEAGQLTIGLAADHTKPHGFVFEDGENNHVAAAASVRHRRPRVGPGDGESYAEMLVSAKQDPIKVRKESSLSLEFKGLDVPVPAESLLSECEPASVVGVMHMGPEEQAYLSAGAGRGW